MLFGAGAINGPRGGESAMKKNVSQMKEETDSREQEAMVYVR